MYCSSILLCNWFLTLHRISHISKKYINKKNIVQEKMSQDFPPSVFHQSTLPLSPFSRPRSNVEYCSDFAETFEKTRIASSLQAKTGEGWLLKRISHANTKPYDMRNGFILYCPQYCGKFCNLTFRTILAQLFYLFLIYWWKSEESENHRIPVNIWQAVYRQYSRVGRCLN
jgi:hypothetical protein